MLAGYDPNVLMSNENYEYSGIIGECEDYDTYKKLLEDRREMNRQKMLMLQEDEKNWYKEIGYGLKVES